MCPDPQLLSIYLDGELPSPWKEKMENHFSNCSGCREKLDNYRQIHLTMHQMMQQKLGNEAAAEDPPDEQDPIEAAKDRVWQNLLSAMQQPEQRLRRRGFARPSRGMWQRRLSIPMPAAAAAAIVLAVLAALMLRGGFNRQLNDPSANARMILASEEALPAIIPAADMNGVLQYLGSDGADIIILRLPESSSFSSSGEPAILRAADYSRRRR